MEEKALCQEIDDYYDVDDGYGNLPGPLMVEYEKARATIKKATE